MAAFTVGYRVGVGDLRGVPDDIHFGASPPMKPAAPDSMNARMLATTPCRGLSPSQYAPRTLHIHAKREDRF